jgi:hypothetical protein
MDEQMTKRIIASWHTRTIFQQMGNIGSEVGRAFKWKKVNPSIAKSASYRALELIDWIISDHKNKKYLKELTRMRELFVDSFLGIINFIKLPKIGIVIIILTL